MKQPMKSRNVLPKNIPGVGWGGVGHTGMGWGGSYRGGVGVGHGGVGHILSNLVTEVNHQYLHTSPPWKLLGITRGAKFNYNHTLNCLELLGEQNFNYNHTPKCQSKTITICTLYHLVITHNYSGSQIQL